MRLPYMPGKCPSVTLGLLPRDHHAQRAHAVAMLRLDPQIAHDAVFHGSNQHAACRLLDRLKDVGLALGDVKSGFSADAVTFGRDGGEQCDDAWHIGWVSWVASHGRCKSQTRT